MKGEKTPCRKKKERKQWARTSALLLLLGLLDLGGLALDLTGTGKRTVHLAFTY